MKNSLICILGGGESGVGAAYLAKKKGLNVFVSDKSKIQEKYKTVLCQNDIAWEEGKHTEKDILNAGTIVKSPGIPDTAPIVIEAAKRKIRVISEVEFAGAFTNAKKICVTGSNGKTTTTTMIYEILKRAGLNVQAGGNIGKSFAKLVADTTPDVFVLEISSFQLDGMFSFKSDVAVLTNITPDHLDRYDNDIQKYVASKFRIIRNQGEDDALIYSADDELTNKFFPHSDAKMRKYSFSITKPVDQGACLEGEKIIININKQKEELMTIHNLALQGRHNLYNSMAASVAARIFDVRKTIIKESLTELDKIEHRLESILNIHGIEFINDSKATNVNSTWYALESMKKPVIWIAGGVDKGNDYTTMKTLVRQKVKAIVCLGVDNSNIHNAFAGDVDTIVDASSMKEAAQLAYKLGKMGDVVLLSPACASFDLFDNFEDRGNQFKIEVREL
ncbi:MAG: UDP-N-acetylmuramoyl-L-alanine--D-glutamate ligase [Bacteroidetes bacterium]|nr:UDP-N-acetylmuramoyl-L-alanine--D-glutamate ligase [Bacteroidota bacterium]MBU1718271.1 UDP-N-acetylmuramoyl-L-alanine--D-glutamate ligase [Bacteroidota bacterium]